MEIIFHSPDLVHTTLIDNDSPLLHLCFRLAGNKGVTKVIHYLLGWCEPNSGHVKKFVSTWGIRIPDTPGGKNFLSDQNLELPLF